MDCKDEPVLVLVDYLKDGFFLIGYGFGPFARVDIRKESYLDGGKIIGGDCLTGVNGLCDGYTYVRSAACPVEALLLRVKASLFSSDLTLFNFKSPYSLRAKIFFDCDCFGFVYLRSPIP